MQSKYAFIMLLYFEFIINCDSLVGYYETLISSRNVEFVWQNPIKNVVGVVFLAHGCSHSATDWWPKSPSCTNCIGLPVEQSIVKSILNQNFVAVASSSVDRSSKCWSHEDIDYVSQVIKFIYKANNISVHVPLYALGVSSGGYFVSLFSSEAPRNGLKVSAICVQISPINMFKNHPPTIFIHMERDSRLSNHIQKLLKVMNQQRIHYIQYKCQPKIITSDYFYTHGNILTEYDSSKLVAALKERNIIDRVGGLLLKNPLQEDSNWVEVVRATLPRLSDPLVNDISPLYELMKQAYGHHEITDDYIQEALLFFQEQGQGQGGARPESGWRYQSWPVGGG